MNQRCPSPITLSTRLQPATLACHFPNATCVLYILPVLAWKAFHSVQLMLPMCSFPPFAWVQHQNELIMQMFCIVECIRRKGNMLCQCCQLLNWALLPMELMTCFAAHTA